MDNGIEKTTKSKPLSKETIEWVLKAALHLPTFWLIASIIFILLSMFNVAWVPFKSFSLTFQVTGTSALLLGLIWLPALVRIFALVGGGVKTPAGEFTSSGLQTLSQFLDTDTLGILISQTTTAEEKTSPVNKPEARQIRQELEEAYISRIPPGQVYQELAQLAQQYKDVRVSMPSGSQRTYQMESIIGGMRALVSQLHLPPDKIDAYLRSDDEGERLLGLSYLQIHGDERHFEPVKQIIDNPKSAFEQYHALRAMLEMSPNLNRGEKEALRVVLDKQRQYDSSKKQWISPGSDREGLSKQLLSAIRNL